MKVGIAVNTEDVVDAAGTLRTAIRRASVRLGRMKLAAVAAGETISLALLNKVAQTVALRALTLRNIRVVRVKAAVRVADSEITKTNGSEGVRAKDSDDHRRDALGLPVSVRLLALERSRQPARNLSQGK